MNNEQKQKALLEALKAAQTKRSARNLVEELISEMTDADIAAVQDIATDAGYAMPNTMTFNYKTQKWIIGERMAARLKKMKVEV